VEARREPWGLECEVFSLAECMVLELVVPASSAVCLGSMVRVEEMDTECSNSSWHDINYIPQLFVVRNEEETPMVRPYMRGQKEDIS